MHTKYFVTNSTPIVMHELKLRSSRDCRWILRGREVTLMKYTNLSSWFDLEFRAIYQMKEVPDKVYDMEGSFKMQSIKNAYLK